MGISEDTELWHHMVASASSMARHLKKMKNHDPPPPLMCTIRARLTSLRQNIFGDDPDLAETGLGIGVGAQSTLGGTKFLPENMYYKSAKCRNFTWFLPEKYDICPKNLQNSPILHDFCPKNVRILHKNYRKNIFSRILGGHVHASYAYGLAFLQQFLLTSLLRPRLHRGI